LLLPAAAGERNREKKTAKETEGKNGKNPLLTELWRRRKS